MSKKIILFYLLIVFNLYSHAQNSNIFFDSSIYLNTEEKEYIKKNKKIKVCTYPLEKMDYKESLEIKYLDHLFSKVKLAREMIKTKTWSESQEFVKDGKCNLIVGIQKTDERQKYMLFTTPYMNIPLVLMTLNDKHYLFDLELLKEKKVAVVKKHISKTMYQKKYPNYPLVYVDNFDEAMELLKEEKLDVIVEALTIVYPLEGTKTDMKVNRKLDISLDVSFGVEKDNILLHSILEKLINRYPMMNEDQFYKKLLETSIEEKRNYSLYMKIFLLILTVLVLVLYWVYKLKKVIKKVISKNKEQEKLLYYYSKEDAMKNFVGNVSHQWKQPVNQLSALFFYVDSKKALKKDIEKEDLELIIQKGKMIVDILSNTITIFSNFYSQRSQKEDVSKLLEDVMFISKKTLIQNNLKVSIDLENDKKIRGNDLQQVFLVLINNVQNIAVERKIKEPRLDISISSDKNFLIMKFQDNCGGINKNIIDDVFELGTTKTSKGSGLGLFISKKILKEKYDGEIEIKNINNGALFTIKIPII